MRVSCSYDDFIRILRLMISGIEVNEDWYLREYEDIAQAIREGSVESAKQHFMDDGYFEGRLPFPMPVDERWYLEENLDVAESVRKYASVQDSSILPRTAIGKGGCRIQSRCCGNPPICHRGQAGLPVEPCR